MVDTSMGRGPATQKRTEEQEMGALVVKAIVAGVVVLLATIAGCLVGGPAYHVWQQGMQGKAQVELARQTVLQQQLSGQAELKRQEYERQTIFIKARAEREAAAELAAAESTRACGAASAAKIIANSLTPEYLQYLAIQSQKAMADSPNHTTVYIPTGSNGIPITRTSSGGNP